MSVIRIMDCIDQYRVLQSRRREALPDMDQPRFPWQIPYLAAVIELDPLRLASKIGEAEIAIGARLAQNPNGEESEALMDALRTLRFLLEQKSKDAKTDVA